MRASEIPTASHRCSSRRRCGPSALPALLTSVAMLTPLLCRIRWAERPLDPTRRMPPESGHWCPRAPGADLPRTGATPPVHPPEPHSKPASRAPGLSVIPPFPAGYAQYLTFRPHVPQVPARPRQWAPRTGGGPEIQLCPRSGTTPRISVTSPRNRGFSGAVRGPQCASRFGLTLEFELGVQGVSSRACSSGPRRGRFGAGTPGASRSTNQSNRRDLGVCAREHRESGFGAIDSARRPAAETSLRRARGKRCPNLRR